MSLDHRTGAQPSGAPPARWLERIQQARSRLNPSERAVAEYVLRHTESVVHLSITQLAEQVGVSEATVVRFARRLGLRGYHDLKIHLALEVVPRPQHLHEAISEKDDLETAVRKSFAASIQTLEKTLATLNFADLRRAIDILASARRVIVVGVGGSAPVAADAVHKLLKVGIHAIVHVDPHMAAMAASILEPGDVMLGISHSGSTQDVVDALALARKRGASTIVISSDIRAPIDRVADVKLRRVSQETYVRIESSSSRIGDLAIVDALVLGLMLRDPAQAFEYIQRTREAIVPKRY